MTDQADITGLLLAWRGGDAAAIDALMPAVYQELRVIARRHFRGERPGHTLQATALVNEAYLRLIDARRVQWQDRSHFFAMAARVMRRILVDDARAHRAHKRGAGAHQVSLDEGMLVTGDAGPDLAALDDALQTLARFDERKSRVVELRFFGGLTMDEIADVLSVSVGTVNNDWTMAKMWLLKEMTRPSGP